MKKLFKSGSIVNVFTGKVEKRDLLVEDGKIVAFSGDADEIIDVSGKIICPGFIDGHIHIESSMLTPAEFTAAALPHGTSAVIADPHEIANVCGGDGIDFMLEASEGLPITFYIAMPSCVPATALDEAGAVMTAKDIKPFYKKERVISLGEMMNYFGVIAKDGDIMQKIADAKQAGRIINGHAPLLSGEGLDGYIAAGISDDHECSNINEAIEKISKGQVIMIRNGTAAKNLNALLPLFDEPYCRRCILVTDDKHPADLLSSGHIDAIIRDAVKAGKNAVTAIQMATIQAAEHFGLAFRGAVAPGYFADFIVLDELDSLKIRDVYKNGEKVVENGKALPFKAPVSSKEARIKGSFNLPKITAESFMTKLDGKKKCRVIGTVKGELLTEEKHFEIDFDKNDGIDTARDIIKIAVIERHKGTGHIGLGFINGMCLKCGAVASSVSHDSHNLIVIGADEGDMALAAETVKNAGGGIVTVKNGKVLAFMPLPYGGLMTDASAENAAKQNLEVRKAVKELGVPDDIEPLMMTAFISLPVIPHLKMTTFGLADVDNQKILPLTVE